MSTIAGTTHIDRPAETVFEILADPRQEPSYNPAVVLAAKLTPRPMGVGTRFTEQAKTFGRAGEVTIELLQHDPPRHLGWYIGSSGMDVHGDLEFRAEGGGTTVRWTWRFTPRGLRLLGPVVGRPAPRWSTGSGAGSSGTWRRMWPGR